MPNRSSVALSAYGSLSLELRASNPGTQSCSPTLLPSHTADAVSCPKLSEAGIRATIRTNHHILTIHTNNDSLLPSCLACGKHLFYILHDTWLSRTTSARATIIPLMNGHLRTSMPAYHA